MSEEELLELQKAARQVRVDDVLVEYLIQIAQLTRERETVELGISPRGSLSLFRSAQALALVNGRDYCIADDIKSLVLPCFSHRLIVSSRFQSVTRRTQEAEGVLHEILSTVKVPI
jgi:MoxR-like ATPase